MLNRQSGGRGTAGRGEENSCVREMQTIDGGGRGWGGLNGALRAGSSLSGLLQQECSTGCAVEGGGGGGRAAEVK